MPALLVRAVRAQLGALGILDEDGAWTVDGALGVLERGLAALVGLSALGLDRAAGLEREVESRHVPRERVLAQVAGRVRFA